jgi:nitroreductase
MLSNEITAVIRNRRSIRKFTPDSISDEILDTVLEAARWAPSGLNNQPWSFGIVRDTQTRVRLALLTKYSRIIKECNTCICVFYNTQEGYNRDKDLLSIGACIQNMLLSAHSLGIGSVWLGEILNRKTEVNGLLGIALDHELMAVIALGHPAETPRSSRKKTSSLIIKQL